MKQNLQWHIHLFSIATTFWAWYYIAGLWSDYYQTWPWPVSLLILVILPTGILAVCGPNLINGYLAFKSRIRAAIYVAGYFTVPLFFYDVLVLGIYRELGLSFLVSHWYLSAFYVIPWLLIPIIARK